MLTKRLQKRHILAATACVLVPVWPNPVAQTEMKHATTMTCGLREATGGRLEGWAPEKRGDHDHT
jgi:hypothetical protein